MERAVRQYRPGPLATVGGGLKKATEKPTMERLIYREIPTSPRQLGTFCSAAKPVHSLPLVALPTG
jgi:hypothetical protein